MLGVYKDFPESVHDVVHSTTSISEKRLQKAIIEVICQLNKRTFSLEEVATPSIPNCTVMLEFGVAEGGDFNYVDEQEKTKLLKLVDKKLFSTLDFLCIIRYYKVQGETRRPLKFDYYMLRFLFGKAVLELQVFHEKGLMHVTPKDIPSFLWEQINKAFSKTAVKLIEEP